jgi:ribulose-phosphate 3-epimerase
LMISDPDSFIDEFVASGASIVTVHAETLKHLHRTVQYIRTKGLGASVSLNPATPLDVLDYILEDLSMVLLMTVNPGFGGQAFIPQVIPKVSRLRETIHKRGLDIDIEVDGGINPETISRASEAGANVFVAGSAIFCSENYGETIGLMRDRMLAGEKRRDKGP